MPASPSSCARPTPPAWRWPRRCSRRSGETPAAAREAVRRFRDARRGDARRAVPGQGGRHEVPRHLARGRAAAREAVRGRPRQPDASKAWTRRAVCAISGSDTSPPSPADAQPPHALLVRRRVRAVRRHRDETIRRALRRAYSSAPAAGELAAWADGPRRRLSLDHSARSVSAQHLPRHGARLRLRRRRHSRSRCPACSRPPTPRSRWSSASSSTCRCSTPRAREVQEESLAAYRRLLREAPQELRAMFAGALRSAENHRAIIEQFGRFPHRNEVLGRTSTAAEVEWLQRGGETLRSVIRRQRARDGGCAARARAAPRAAPPPAPRRCVHAQSRISRPIDLQARQRASPAAATSLRGARRDDAELARARAPPRGRGGTAGRSRAAAIQSLLAEQPCASSTRRGHCVPCHHLAEIGARIEVELRAHLVRRAPSPRASRPAAAPPSAARTDPRRSSRAVRARAAAVSGPTARRRECASPPRRRASAR